MDDAEPQTTARPWAPLVSRSASMHFDPLLRAPREVRAFVERTVRGWGFGDLADSAELLVSEIVTNVVHHARTEGEATVVALPAGIRVEVRDGAADLPRVRSPDPADPTGRGLNVVDALARRWGVDRDGDRGKIIWFELDDDVDAASTER